MSSYEHPGGYQVLKPFAGGVKDAQKDFDEIGHSKAAKNQRDKLHIGTLSKKQKVEFGENEPLNPSDMKFVLNDFEGLTLKLMMFIVYMSIFWWLF